MSIGFPDYGRQQVQSGPRVLNFQQVVNAVVQTAFVLCSNYAYIDIHADTRGLADKYEFQIVWANDPAGLVQIAKQFITIPPGGQTLVQLPAIGSWFALKVTPATGADVSAITVVILTTNGYAPELGLENTASPILLFNGNVNAGASQTVTAVVTKPGPATWAVNHGANNTWHAQLLYYDFAVGAYVIFAEIHGTTYNLDAVLPVTLPPAPVQMILFNDDAAARTMRGSLTV